MSSLQVRTLTQLLSLEQPKQLYYLEPQLLSYGGSLFIYGKAGAFKSWLAIELMRALAAAENWLIYNTGSEPVKCLMFQAEQPEPLYQERMILYTKSRIPKPADLEDNMLFTTAQDLKLDGLRGIGMLEEAIKIHRPQVVFTDCMYRVIKSSTDLNSVGRFLDDMTRLSSVYGVANVILHHPRKESDEDRGLDEMTGSATINYWADSVLRVTRAEGTTDLSLKWEKTKNARKEVSDVNVQVNQDTLRFTIR